MKNKLSSVHAVKAIYLPVDGGTLSCHARGLLINQSGKFKVAALFNQNGLA